MNAHPKENCVENDDSTKSPVIGHYTNFVRFTLETQVCFAPGDTNVW